MTDLNSTLSMRGEMTSEEIQNLGEGRLKELGRNKKALLIGIYYTGRERAMCAEHLNELESLCDTYGLTTVEKISAPLLHLIAMTCLITIQQHSLMMEKFRCPLIR